MKYLIAAVAGIVALGAPGVAAGVNPEASGNGAQEADARDNQTVCRWQDAVGSRLGRRTCKTRAQWRELDASARAARDRLLDRSQRDREEESPFGPRPQ